jgi:peptidoglycan/LPS O-acetylase OafA/YrhL
MLARPTLPRRPLSVGLLVLAVLCLALVAVAMTNPWRLTALYPVATTSGAVTTLTLGGALIAGTALLRLANTARRAIFGLVGALVAVPALCVGLPVITLHDAFRDAQVAGERVLATSPGLGYSVVAITRDGGATSLLVRSRRSLLSREATVPLAQCSFDPFVGRPPAVPAVAPGSVRFTAQDRVAVPLGPDGDTVTVTFNPETLVPQKTIDMCGEGVGD